MKKKFIIAIPILFMIIPVLLFLFKPKQPSFLFPSAPTPTPITIPSIQQTPIIIITPGIQYNPNSEQKIRERIDNKQPLSQQDTKTKNSIRSSLQNKSGSPVTTNLFRVDYLFNNDIFQVEILTTNIEAAKKQAVDWFLSQGFTEIGICDLPVSFYLSWNVKQELQKSGQQISFNSLPDFCQ